MTENEWLACSSSSRMLQFLGQMVSDRKLRLLSTACLQHGWRDGRIYAGTRPPGRGVHCPTDTEVVKCNLIRDIFGNPFRVSVIDAAWLRPDSPTRLLAKGIFDSERFAELPVLADVLAQAGCADDNIMAHCHANVDHVRGCWVVDLALGFFW